MMLSFLLGMAAGYMLLPKLKQKLMDLIAKIKAKQS